MASQVRQVFYIEDPIKVALQYVMKRVPRDLYGLEEKNCPNIEQVFWSELDDYAHDISESHNVTESINQTRDNEVVETMDIPSHLLEVQEDEEAEEDSYIDDTDYDQMDINKQKSLFMTVTSHFCIPLLTLNDVGNFGFIILYIYILY